MALIRFRLVLTPGGFGVFGIALAVLVRSLSARNVYEIVLAVAVLGLGLILSIIGAWGSRKLSSLEPGWKPPVPFGANAVEGIQVTGFNLGVPYFFRLHFMVKGRFFPVGGPRCCRVYAETTVPRGAGETQLNLSFPISGVFHGEGFCRLRDIFGFFSFPCGVSHVRSLTVRSAPGMKKPFRIDPHTGAEDQRNKNTSNEERYYMREYAPGDRFRDINWKSSDRIDTLITRISPDNQEKVSRIEVYFRNFGPSGGGAKNQASLKDLWLFDRAKARLTQFLRAVNDEQNRYIFCIHTAQKNWEITDQDELELFLEELGSLSFAPPRNEPPFSLGSEKNAAPGGVYVFSTSCDPGLPGFLLSCQPRPVFLFFVRSGAPKIKADTVERLYVRDFLTQGFILAPGLLVSGSAQEVNPPGLAGGTIEIDYAEVRL